MREYAVLDAARQHLVLTSRVVLCDLDNFKLRPLLQVTPPSSYAPLLQSADRPLSEDYSVSQTTLDQVFVSFARQQRDEEDGVFENDVDLNDEVQTSAT